jgi:phosphatidylserine/phosphatidylglycerophosphate/cardiolipin synthase-like enzyme
LSLRPEQLYRRGQLQALCEGGKLVIVGRKAELITGSFNFTKATEMSNAENLLIIRSPELAAK